MDVQIIPVRIDGEIHKDQDILEAAGRLSQVQDGDVVVFSQKIISKQEGRLVQLETVKPSELASAIASAYGKDPRIVHLVLDESVRIVRMFSGVLIMQTHDGIICANAGIDESNVPLGYATLLPKNPDASAARLRESIMEMTGKNVAVLISDTFGRPFRMGQIDCTIGSAGIKPIQDYAGSTDTFGRTLRVTAIAMADQICAAAQCASTKTSNSPIIIVRGCKFEWSKSGSQELLREQDQNLFR